MLFSRTGRTVFRELFCFNTHFRDTKELTIVNKHSLSWDLQRQQLKIQPAVFACFYHQHNKYSKPKLISRLAASTSINFHKTKLDGRARIDETRKKVQKAKQVVKERLEGIKENVWTIPNALCVIRIALTPVLAYCVVSSQFGIALSIFAVAGITDLVSIILKAYFL